MKIVFVGPISLSATHNTHTEAVTEFRLTLFIVYTAAAQAVPH